MIENNDEDEHRNAIARMLAVAQGDLPLAAKVFMIGVAMRSDEEGCVWLDDAGMPISPAWMDEDE
jgi:hypothetical protein